MWYAERMRPIIRPLIIVPAILFALILIAGFFGTLSTAPETIAISRLAKMVNDGSIKDIVVRGDDLSITAVGDTAYQARKETGASIFETLANAGVDEAKLAAVTITVEGPSLGDEFLGNFLPALISFLLTLGR